MIFQYGANIGKESSSNTEGVFNLAANDELIVIASTTCDNSIERHHDCTQYTNTETEVEGDSTITKTSWIITRVNY